MSATVESVLGTEQARAIGPSGEFPARIEDSKSGRVPFALAIFVSAFLLFQVPLLLGKEVLLLFGGASAVWTVCVFVFQLLLGLQTHDAFDRSRAFEAGMVATNEPGVY